MSSAGQQLVAGRIPGERIATTVQTVDSATFTTTEVEIMSVTAPLVVDRTYRVRFTGQWNSDTSGDEVLALLRLTNTSGDIRQQHRVLIDLATTSQGYGDMLEFEFTPQSTGNVTFIVSANRTAASTGNCRLEAQSSRPAYLYIDYIRG